MRSVGARRWATCAALAVFVVAGCGSDSGQEAADDADRVSAARDQVSAGQCNAALEDAYGTRGEAPELSSPAEETVRLCRRAGYDPVWEEQGISARDEDYWAVYASDVNAAPDSTAAPTTAAPTTAAPAPTTAAPAVEPEPVAVMPDVVCMNLQDAQDRIQAAGVFYSRSFDATGQGRNQVIDSNWQVVSQEPPAGSPIGEGDAMLGAVKYGEPGGC